MQERRVIEYVALGDFATAVGFLLASTPEKSARYYRDALCTLALAVRSCIPSGFPAVATALVHYHCLCVQSFETRALLNQHQTVLLSTLLAHTCDSPGQRSVIQQFCTASLHQHSLMEDCHAYVPNHSPVPNTNKLHFIGSISIHLQPADWRGP